MTDAALTTPKEEQWTDGLACGAGEEAAGRRSLEALRFASDAIFTDAKTVGDLFGR